MIGNEAVRPEAAARRFPLPVAAGRRRGKRRRAKKAACQCRIVVRHGAATVMTSNRDVRWSAQASCIEEWEESLLAVSVVTVRAERGYR